MGDSGGQIDSVLNGRLRIDYARNRLIVSDTNNIDKLLAGIDEDGDVRVKLAQAGIDVKIATPDQLIWSSDFKLFKIMETDTIFLNTTTVAGPSVADFTKQVTFTEEYLSPPVVLVFVSDGFGNVTGLWQGTNVADHVVSSSGIAISRMDKRSVSSNLTGFTAKITLSNGQVVGWNVGNFQLRYYVLQETAA